MERITSAITISIPESSYFLNALGVEYKYLSNATTKPSGVAVQVERLSAEGGQKWDSIYADIGGPDPEVGLRLIFSQSRNIFKRFPGDLGPDRIDLETARRWKAILSGSGYAWADLNLFLTYHSITFTVSGTISGSGGGTVNLDLHRVDNGEKVLGTSRVGNGAYSFTWYDDTASLFVVAREDATHLGRSDNALAA